MVASKKKNNNQEKSTARILLDGIGSTIGVLSFLVSSYLGILWIVHDFNPDFLRISKCTDDNGIWNYQERVCAYRFYSNVFGSRRNVTASPLNIGAYFTPREFTFPHQISPFDRQVVSAPVRVPDTVVSRYESVSITPVISFEPGKFSPYDASLDQVPVSLVNQSQDAEWYLISKNNNFSLAEVTLNGNQAPVYLVTFDQSGFVIDGVLIGSLVGNDLWNYHRNGMVDRNLNVLINKELQKRRSTDEEFTTLAFESYGYTITPDGRFILAR